MLPSKGDKRGERGAKAEWQNERTEEIRPDSSLLNSRSESSTERERSWRLTARNHISDEREESCRAGLRYWFLGRIYERCSQESLPTERKTYGAILLARWPEYGWGISTLWTLASIWRSDWKLFWWCNSAGKTYHGRCVWKRLLLRGKRSGKVHSVIYDHCATF